MPHVGVTLANSHKLSALQLVCIGDWESQTEATSRDMAGLGTMLRQTPPSPMFD